MSHALNFLFFILHLIRNFRNKFLATISDPFFGLLELIILDWFSFWIAFHRIINGDFSRDYVFCCACDVYIYSVRFCTVAFTIQHFSNSIADSAKSLFLIIFFSFVSTESFLYLYGSSYDEYSSVWNHSHNILSPNQTSKSLSIINQLNIAQTTTFSHTQTIIPKNMY